MSATAPADVTALILGGRRPTGKPDPVAVAGGESIKAFVKIGGVSMIARVIRTLQESGAVNDLHLCLPAELDLAPAGSEVVSDLACGNLARTPAAASPSLSVREFVAPRAQTRTILVTTADHPLLTPRMVNEFLQGFAAGQAEAAFALTRTDAIVARYPQSRRTRLAFADGDFSGCNLFAFRGVGALHVLDFWRRVEQHRKQPWRVAQAVGWGTLLLYLLRQLDHEALATRLGRRSGTRLQAIVLDDPHAGIDVDSADDLRLVTAILSNRRTSRS